MELFDDSLRFATGFVKPKTTSILFEKILISDDLLDEETSHFGYSYIPREVLLKNSIFIDYGNLHYKRLDNSGFNMLSAFLENDDVSYSEIQDRLVCNNLSADSKRQAIPLTLAIHESAQFSADLPLYNDKGNNATPLKDNDLVQFKYSKNRNKGIQSIVKRCQSLGISIIPIYFSPTEFEKQYNCNPDSSSKSPAISICINNLPEIIEEKLDWEQVLDLRSDKESIAKIRRFKNWLNIDLLHKTESEMRSIIDKAIDDYSFALRKHGIQTLAGAISTVSAISLAILNTISQNGSFDATGITIASGISVFAIKSYVDRLEAKRHPIALIYDMMK